MEDEEPEVSLPLLSSSGEGEAESDGFRVSFDSPASELFTKFSTAGASRQHPLASVEGGAEAPTMGVSNRKIVEGPSESRLGSALVFARASVAVSSRFEELSEDELASPEPVGRRRGGGVAVE